MATALNSRQLWIAKDFSKVLDINLDQAKCIRQCQRINLTILILSLNSLSLAGKHNYMIKRLTKKAQIFSHSRGFFMVLQILRKWLLCVIIMQQASKGRGASRGEEGRKSHAVLQWKSVNLTEQILYVKAFDQTELIEVFSNFDQKFSTLKVHQFGSMYQKCILTQRIRLLE